MCSGEKHDFQNGERAALISVAENYTFWQSMTDEEREKFINQFMDLWERLKEAIYAIISNIADLFASLRPILESWNDSLSDFAQEICEIQHLTAECEQEKRRLRFFGRGKRDIFKKRVHIKRAIFQKPKYRKWRISVYGFYG